MHILAGRFKSRELKSPKGDKTRPTSSKVRGSIFDILKNQLEDATFLDLFAGTGAMGIEALSRGAKKATFVEKDRMAASCIRENLATLKLEEEAVVHQLDVLAALKRLIKNNEHFDIVYIDPPYALSIDTILEEIPQLLSPNGLVILEQSKRATPESPTLKLIDERQFGDTTVYFFQA